MLEKEKPSNKFIGEFNQSQWILEDHNATMSFGQYLAKRLACEDILLLDGPLGAGKTSLVKGIAKGLSNVDQYYHIAVLKGAILIELLELDFLQKYVALLSK